MSPSLAPRCDMNSTMMPTTRSWPWQMCIWGARHKRLTCSPTATSFSALKNSPSRTLIRSQSTSRLTKIRPSTYTSTMLTLSRSELRQWLPEITGVVRVWLAQILALDTSTNYPCAGKTLQTCGKPSRWRQSSAVWPITRISANPPKRAFQMKRTVALKPARLVDVPSLRIKMASALGRSRMRRRKTMVLVGKVQVRTRMGASTTMKRTMRLM